MAGGPPDGLDWGSGPCQLLSSCGVQVPLTEADLPRQSSTRASSGAVLP